MSRKQGGLHVLILYFALMTVFAQFSRILVAYAYSPHDGIKAFPANFVSNGTENRLEHLSKRAVTTFKEAIIEGYCVLDIIQYGMSEGTPYTQFSQIASSGWGPYSGNLDDGFPYGLGGVLSSQGWHQGDFQEFKNSYKEPWLTPAFTASYIVWANPVAGAIIVDFAASPKKPLVAPGATPASTPPLSRLSDYTFLVYQRACTVAGQNVQQCLQRLEWIIHHSVTNPVSENVAATVMGQSDYSAWPGKSFQTEDDDNGKALVGCPNGYGVGFLIADHSHLLGGKTIDYVNVFGDDVYGMIVDVNFAYHVTALTTTG